MATLMDVMKDLEKGNGDGGDASPTYRVEVPLEKLREALPPETFKQFESVFRSLKLDRIVIVPN
jgi:hypothetical protein